MSRRKLYRNTSSYLRTSIGEGLFILISTITCYVFVANRGKLIAIGLFALMSLTIVPDWIRRRKYFGDILFKRLKSKRYKVIYILPGSIHYRIRYVRIIVLNEETGLKEEFSYFNSYSEVKIDEESKLESIEFVYLSETKVVVEIIDFQVKEGIRNLYKRSNNELKPEECKLSQHVVIKFFRDFEKEIVWINEMSEKGLALCEYSWGTYIFEETLPREYIFTILPFKYEMIDKVTYHFIEELEKSNIEFLGGSTTWVHIRKKKSDGTFGEEMEIIPKIKYYKGHYKYKRKALIALWIIAILNGILSLLFATMTNLASELLVLLIAEIIAIIIGIIFELYLSKIKRRIAKLIDQIK